MVAMIDPTKGIGIKSIMVEIDKIVKRATELGDENKETFELIEKLSINYSKINDELKAIEAKFKLDEEKIYQLENIVNDLINN